MAAPEKKGVSSDLPEDIWMMRPCEIYLEEFSDCASFKGRFHQYYTAGSCADCEPWQRNYKDCLKFRNTGDVLAAEAIVADEKKRREVRLKAARGNNVWEYRASPPADWNSQPTKWVEERQESVLAKAQTQREKTGTLSQPETRSQCIIS